MNVEGKKADRILMESQLQVALRAAIGRSSDQQLEDAQPRVLAERLIGTEVENAQIRNLENVAYTTNKISDITDFLKKQIGKDVRAKRWAKGGVGHDLIAALVSLRSEADKIVKNELDRFSTVIDNDFSRRVHLSLCREFVKHLTAEFLYRNKKD